MKMSVTKQLACTRGVMAVSVCSCTTGQHTSQTLTALAWRGFVTYYPSKMDKGIYDWKRRKHAVIFRSVKRPCRSYRAVPFLPLLPSHSLRLLITHMRNEESIIHRVDRCTSDRFCQPSWVGATTVEAWHPIEQRRSAQFESPDLDSGCRQLDDCPSRQGGKR